LIIKPEVTNTISTGIHKVTSCQSSHICNMKLFYRLLVHIYHPSIKNPFRKKVAGVICVVRHVLFFCTSNLTKFCLACATTAQMAILWATILPRHSLFDFVCAKLKNMLCILKYAGGTNISVMETWQLYFPCTENIDKQQ